MTSLSHEKIHTSQVILKGYKDLLSVKDLMEIFGVSTQTIRKELQQGKFGTPIKIGRAYKIPKVYIIQRYFDTCKF